VAEAFPRCALLRRHPAPPRAAFDSLLAAARAVGVELRFGSGKELAESLDAAEVPGRPAFQKLLRILTTRCMMQAVYFPSGAVAPDEFFHYGLAAPIYTHFTSPIRRYADVVVHRLLAAALGLAPLPAAYQDKPHMTALADNMNKRHLMSQLAGRASASLHTNIFFRARVVVETALVMRLRSNGAVLLVPRFALERSVLLGGGGWGGAGRGGAADGGGGAAPRALLYDAEQQTLADAADPLRLRLRIFDEVKVALFVEERARGLRELVMRIVAPPFHDMPPVGPGVMLEDRTVAAASGK
jgi:exosome complex exonuclease DIS3/RRP44